MQLKIFLRLKDLGRWTFLPRKGTVKIFFKLFLVFKINEK